MRSADAAAAEIERRHVQRTGSDDFDVPSVAHGVRDAAGLPRHDPLALYAAAERALEGEDLTDEQRAAQLAKVAEAVGL